MLEVRSPLPPVGKEMASSTSNALRPLLLLAALCAVSPAEEVAPSVTTSEKFYDVVTSLSIIDQTTLSAWHAGISQAIERHEADLDTRSLLRARLAFFQQLIVGYGDKGGPTTKPLTVPASSNLIVNAEISLLALAGRSPPSPQTWTERFQAITDSAEACWDPNFHSFAFQLASERAVADGNLHAAFQYGLWSMAYANLGDRSVLRRNARIRVLNLLASMDKQSSEVAQLAAMQLAARERVPQTVDQLARDTLGLGNEVELPEINKLARRVTLAGPDRSGAKREMAEGESYLLSTLHSLSQPGPLVLSRKRYSLYNQAIEVAESNHAAEAALRLKGAHLVLLLRMQRFAQVLESARLLYQETHTKQLTATSLSIAISGAIAAMQLQDLAERQTWLARVKAEAEASLDTKPEQGTLYSPRKVLNALVKVNSAGPTDVSETSAQMQKLTSVLPAAGIKKDTTEHLRIASNQPETLPAFPWTIVAAAVGGFSLLAFSFLRRSHARRHEMPAADAPRTKMLQAAPPTAPQPENAASTSGLTPIQLGQFLREATRDLTARNNSASFELASDAEGDYDSIFAADLAKLKQLVRHLGRETLRAAEDDRIMVGGQLSEQVGLVTKTLDVSFTYRLTACTEVGQLSLTETWAENNALASLVHILDCDVSHQGEPGGLGCLLASIPLPMHLGGTVANGKTDANDLAILVIDNDVLVLRSMAAALQALGFECTGCVSWESARKHLQPPWQYAAVITDIQMPKWDGFHVLDEVSRLPALKRPRVIAMSDQADLRIASRISNAGFDGVLNKPYTLGQLASVVRMACAG